MRLRNWYKDLPPRKRKSLWWMIVGVILFLYAPLGLLGIIANPHPAR